MDESVNDWNVYTQEPEAQSVGCLNQSVRRLREERYQDRVAWQAEREALVKALEELRGAVLDVIEEVNIEHVAAAGPDGDAEDCPADDTCRCPHIQRLEAALKLANSALA